MWQCATRLKERHYSVELEREAFRIGYADGFYDFDRMRRHPFLNAYSAGYWEGFGDAHDLLGWFARFAIAIGRGLSLRYGVRVEKGPDE